MFRTDNTHIIVRHLDGPGLRYSGYGQCGANDDVIVDGTRYRRFLRNSLPATAAAANRGTARFRRHET